MWQYVNPVKSGKNSLVGFYHKGRKYDITEMTNPVFVDGVTIYDVKIGNQSTKLYRDEISNRWFVVKRKAA